MFCSYIRKFKFESKFYDLGAESIKKNLRTFCRKENRVIHLGIKKQISLVLGVSFQKKTPWYKWIEKSSMNATLTKKFLLVLEMIEKSIEMTSNVARMGDKDNG